MATVSDDQEELTNFYDDNINNNAMGKPFDKNKIKECVEDILVY